MKKRIVLLEDDRQSRKGMAALLRNEGHEVTEVQHALEAQAWIAQCTTPPDVAVVDIHLPGLRGDEWALFLKDLLPETRIVFVSGLPGLAGIDRYGPDATYFQKPFRVEDFLHVVSGDTN